MAAQYVVVAACVVAKTHSDTGEGYYYRDAILPSGVPAAEKQRLVDAGLVKVVEDDPVLDAILGEDVVGDDDDVEVVDVEPGSVVEDVPSRARRTRRS